MALQFKTAAVQSSSTMIDPVMMVSISDLVEHERLQKRVEKFNSDHVRTDLLVKINEGIELDPVEVVRESLEDGTVILWLWHGHNRKQAHVLAGRTVINAKVRNGTFADACRLALTPNNDHGLRLSDADKQRTFDLAVEQFRSEIESGSCGVNELARRTNLSPAYVSKRMQELKSTGEVKKPDVTTTTRNGKAIAIKTKNITGRKPNITVDELKSWISDWVINTYPTAINATLQHIALNSEKAESLYLEMCDSGIPTPHRQPDIMEAARQLITDETSSVTGMDDREDGSDGEEDAVELPKPVVVSISDGSTYMQAKEPTLCIVVTRAMAERMLELAQSANDGEIVLAIETELRKVAK